MRRLEREQVVPGSLDEVFAFYARAENLEEITPRFLRFRIVTPSPILLRPGARIDYALSLWGIPLRWRTRITVWEPKRRFVDVQEFGPFAHWHHLHEFEARGATTLVRDVVDYAMPFEPLGGIVHELLVRHALDRIFDYRRDEVARRWSPLRETART